MREGTEPQPASLPDALREVPPLGCPFKTRVTDRGGGQGTSRRAGEGEARPPAWTAPCVPVRVGPAAEGSRRRGHCARTIPRPRDRAALGTAGLHLLSPLTPGFFSPPHTHCDVLAGQQTVTAARPAPPSTSDPRPRGRRDSRRPPVPPSHPACPDLPPLGRGSHRLLGLCPRPLCVPSGLRATG